MKPSLDRARRASDQRAETQSGIDASLRAEVLRGLTEMPKTLPPKLFYDATGAALFERIRQAALAVPGVRAAAVSVVTPVSGSTWNNLVQIVGGKELAEAQSLTNLAWIWMFSTAKRSRSMWISGIGYRPLNKL